MAFTLAETLITLVIIGVVAALTVPTLIVKYQKEQIVTRLKKAYSALAQTTQRAVADYGAVSTWQYVSQGNINSTEFARTYMIPYLNIINTCTDSSGNIITSKECNSNYSYLNNTLGEVNLDSYPRFILTDGTLVTVRCSYNNSDGSYCNIVIDVNRTKNTNILGKDVFVCNYWIKAGNLVHATSYNGKFIPYGAGNTRRVQLADNSFGGCNKTATQQAGSRCFALIMQDNWQIKDDYPW